MSSFKFFQVGLWAHRCFVIILGLSLGSILILSNAVANNKDETQRDPATVIEQKESDFYLEVRTAVP